MTLVLHSASALTFDYGTDFLIVEIAAVSMTCDSLSQWLLHMRQKEKTCRFGPGLRIPKF